MECRMFLRLSIFLIFFVVAVSTNVYTKDIPIIVISAGKSVQSKSTVGSDVSVVDQNTISSSGESFVGDILSENLMGMNYFQSGGYGTTSGIQLRGQPKRYSTVYLNGIKLSDPSTPSNDYYFGNLMNNSLEQVEVLKGSQSSLYGSGAIAGTVNLYTKKGREGHHQTASISNSRYGTLGLKSNQNFNLTYDGKENDLDYFVSLSNFSDMGISARVDDNENDRYRNDNYVVNIGYQINDLLRTETYINYTDTFLEYDAVGLTSSDFNSSDDQQSLLSTKLIIDNGNLVNTIAFNKTYFLRETSEGFLSDSPSNKMHEGQRDTFNLIGQYNLNFDTRITYGLEYEVDEAEIPSFYGRGSTFVGTHYMSENEEINSQYVDLQFRPFEKLFSTVGVRRDEHSIAGSYETGRATLAYKMNSNSKIRSSFGTGLRFPSLNEYYFGATVLNTSTLVPEESTSFDIGIDQVIPKYNLNFSATYFDIEYENYIGGWASNIDNGNSYVQKNTSAINYSRGWELTSDWEPMSDLKVNLGFTRTKSFDGSTCSNPSDSCNDEMNVRVPRNALNSSITKNFINNLTATAQYKYVGERRDYGGSDNGFKQVILDDYSLFNLYADYGKFNLSLKNIFNEGYNEAFNYSTPGRTLNIKFTNKF
jgi:vitamin B12 transporter